MGHKSRKTAAKATLLEVARSQHGVFTMTQAAAAGLSPRQVYRLVAAGEWISPLPSLFATSYVLDWLQQVAAACLWAGKQAAASHRTAAALWELEEVMREGVEISTSGRRSSPRDWLRVHQVSRAFPIQRRQGIPVTSVARTLIDLGGVVSPHCVEIALEDALRRRLTTIDRLRTELGGDGRGLWGAKTLSKLIDGRNVTGPSESELERRVLRVLADAGLPPPVCQYVVTTSSGFTARIDFAYPQAMLAIEADGYRWHSARQQWSRDRTRLNELVAMGWRVLHVTWADIDAGGAEFVRTVRKILGQQSML